MHVFVCPSSFGAHTLDSPLPHTTCTTHTPHTTYQKCAQNTQENSTENLIARLIDPFDNAVCESLKRRDPKIAASIEPILEQCRQVRRIVWLCMCVYVCMCDCVTVQSHMFVVLVCECECECKFCIFMWCVWDRLIKRGQCIMDNGHKNTSRLSVWVLIVMWCVTLISSHSHTYKEQTGEGIVFRLENQVIVEGESCVVQQH